MNLKFNFNDQLFWIHNVLPVGVYKKMYSDLIKNRNKMGFIKTNTNWPTYKEEIDNKPLSYGQADLTKNKVLTEYFSTYHTLLKHNPFVNFLNHRLESHLRLSKYNQHLTWHGDDAPDRTHAVTFYFNKSWNQNWGGELMFKSNKGSGFIPVVGNSMCIVKCGLVHKVNPVLKKTHPRFSIQTWAQPISGNINGEIIL